MHQCLAPCAGLASKTEYKTILTDVSQFLEGKNSDLLPNLQAQMEKCAEELDFEKAAAIRDRITALQAILEKQKVLSSDEADRDIIAVVKDDRGSAIQMLYIRGGRLIGQSNYMMDGSKDASPTEAVQEFVKQYYATAPEIPREVLLPLEIEERAIVQTWLRQKRGSAVTIEVPQGGEGLRLVDMAAKNAQLALETMALELEAKEEWAQQAISQLSDEVGLTAPALRIEGYDISNIQGKMPVGSMVVSENGIATKDEYRRFKIKWNPEEPNDFAMMHEVITRRLRRYLDGDPKFMNIPDLIMIDGGKGQLGAALEARDALNLSFPMVGLAKKQEIIFVPDAIVGTSKEGLPIYSYREVILPLTSPGLMLLRKLRDEAHRFAITFHRKLRDKRMHGSVLDEIPGIGPKRRRLLLRTFGSVEGIRRASVEDIASVPTLTLTQAKLISEYLRTDSS